MLRVTFSSIVLVCVCWLSRAHPVRAISNSELRNLVDACRGEGWASSVSGDACDRMFSADTRTVSDMSKLFYGAFSFNGDLSRWDTSQVLDMSQMFRDASSFNGDISTWKTGKVTSMSSMFEFAMVFNGNISQWDVSSVIDLSYAFLYAMAFNQDVSSWETGSVSTMLSTFARAPSFNADLSAWNTDGTNNMRGMFADAAAFNGDISGWNTSAVSDMRYMFNGAAAFNVDLSGWDTRAVSQMDFMFDGASAFNRDLCPWKLRERQNETTMQSMFDQSPLATVPHGCEPTCHDDLQNNNEDPRDCGGDLRCVGGCAAESSCSDGIVNQDEQDVDCGGIVCPPCVTSSTSMTPSPPPPPSAVSSSYGVVVSSRLLRCSSPASDGDDCWEITLTLTGSPPASSKRALYVYSPETASQVPFPCSLQMSRCECLRGIVASGVYYATTVRLANETSGSVCRGETYNSSAFPDIGAAMFESSATAISGIRVDVMSDAYRLELSESALRSMPGAVAGIDGGQQWQVVVGFADLVAVGHVDVFDAVRHERRVTLQKTTFSFSSSVSLLETSSWRFAHARLHRIHDSNGVHDSYYVSVSFVVSPQRTSGQISDLEIPTSSIHIKGGSTGTEVAISCHPNGTLSGDTRGFTDSCGPFPGESSPPLCAGSLLASDSGGAASLFVPLAQVVDDDSLVIEFRVLSRSSGADSPAVDTVAVTIENIGSGAVEWCRVGDSAAVDLVEESELAVTMYAGVVLPGSDGLSSLTVIGGNGSTDTDSDFPAARTSLMDGVVTVGASYNTNSSVTLVRLAAAYVDDPRGSIGDHVRIPSPRYAPATGAVELDTSDVCVTSNQCVVRDLVIDGVVQSAQQVGSSAQVLAVHASTEAAAGEWLKATTASDTDFVESVGTHFHRQLAESPLSQAYLVNPRSDTTSTQTSVGEQESSAVVIMALLEVGAPRSGGQRRAMLRRVVTSSSGAHSIASSALCLQLSPIHQAASTFGVSDHRVTAWSVQIAIGPAEVCLSADELTLRARSRMLDALSGAADDVLDVQVTRIRVDRAGTDCRHGGGRRGQGVDGAPSVVIEALVIFQDHAGPPVVDVEKLASAPGILSAVLLTHDDVEQDTQDRGYTPDSASVQDGSTSRSRLLLVGGGFAAGVAGAIAVVIALRKPVLCAGSRGRRADPVTSSVVVMSSDNRVTRLDEAYDKVGNALATIHAEAEGRESGDEGIVVAV